jgi:hypothetical protein
MSTALNLTRPDSGAPRTMKYCQACHRETPHQINGGQGILALVCVPCWLRDLAYELERD